MGEFLPVSFLLSPRMASDSRWKRILIHHSAGHDTPGLDADDIRRQHLGQGWQDVGYHFLIELIDAEIVITVGRPLNQDGAHCPGRNKDSIGVVIIGDFTHAPPHKAILAELTRRLLKPLMEICKISKDMIQFHREHKATECPGKAFKRELLMQYLEA